MKQNFDWPLMKSNFNRQDLDDVIQHLQQEDPKLTHGPKVRDFEQAWSSWLGVKHSIMVNSGASANDISMLMVREKYGVGEIIVPGLTWVSDIASVIHAGHTPVFVDINPRTLSMNSDEVAEVINSKTKAVFLTHVLGLNGLSDSLVSLLREKNIALIEDVCESHGATHNGKKVGTFGEISNFSFYYAHHITTIEGGMICTNDDSIAEMARMMRSHGLVREISNPEIKKGIIEKYPDLNPDFIFAYAAHNMRPTEINGILGLAQLRRLDSCIEQRRLNFKKFLDILDKEVFFSDFETDGNSNYAFILVLKESSFILRDKIEKILNEAGIEFRRGLSGGGNQLRQPYLKDLKNLPSPDTLKVTEHVHNFSWYLGNYPELDWSFFARLEDVFVKIKGAYQLIM
jgi:CDP-6-deoxy-D-xylo-4-hexulose-3-dehydrase